MKVPNTTENELLAELSALALDSNILVRKALAQAFKSHHAQTRDDGASYLEQHVYSVTLSVIRYYRTSQKQVTTELVAGALLHDVLEDDADMTDEQFRKEFGEKVFSIVKPLSKPDYREYPGNTKEDKKYALNLDYFASLRGAPEESRIIKLADRLNNILCIHLSPKLGKMKFYVKETEEFYMPFAEEVSEYYYNIIDKRIEELRARKALPNRKINKEELSI
jgi:(p)ppGpp synthase/HD superfamily hydrolase